MLNTPSLTLTPLSRLAAGVPLCVLRITAYLPAVASRSRPGRGIRSSFRSSGTNPVPGRAGELNLQLNLRFNSPTNS